VFADGSPRTFELAGDVLEHVLELVVEVEPTSSPCRGLVVRSDGVPIAGAEVELDGNRVTTAAEIEVRVVDMPHSLHWRTDAAGRLQVEALVTGSYELEVRPRSLSTAAATKAYAQANGWQALQREWVPIGAITVAPGVASPQRLVLPAAWDR
jgi:hypothetical protein